MHEASLDDTCTYESLTSCDDCSTRYVQVWTTSYDLAIHSFAGSNRYLCLWSAKVSETYATEIYASKDDLTIIHVIKDRKKLNENKTAQSPCIALLKKCRTEHGQIRRN